MARRPDDDDFENYRNFDVDDIFESDEDDFEIETDVDEEEDISDDEFEKYLYDGDEEKMITEEETESESEVEVELDETASALDNELDTDLVSSKEEETVEENDSEEIPNEKSETEEVEDESEKFLYDTENEKMVSEEEFKQNLESNETSAEETEVEESVSEESEEEVIVNETSSEEKDEVVEEEPKIEEKVETSTEEVKTEETFATMFNRELDKSKQYDYCKNSDDKETIDAMVNKFREQANHFYNKYTEENLLAYIKEFIDKDDNRNFFRDMYIQTYCKYSLAIDFSNKVAEETLWVITAGFFADYIEDLKRSGVIESEVVCEKARYDPDKIIEDRGVALNKQYQKAQNAKYAQYKLDRTIFNISEESDNEELGSIFDDKRTLDRDFYESEFYAIHKEVMTSDKFADMSSIYSNVIINEASSFIPIIDYSTGVRLICIDTNDADQYHLNPLIISRKVPFSYQVNPRNVKVRILYLDDAKNRTMAVICSLKKLVAFDKIKPRYKITLAHNYVVAYTTEAKWIEMFEKGDPDTKAPENSTYYMSKPSNMCIGLIVLDKKSDKDKRAIRRHQIARDVGKYEPASADDYNIQFVISARISRNDLRLRNPTIPREDRYVEYTITQYNECNPVIISDGFQTLVACIIREHKNNYDPGTPYSISYEYDRDGLVTPAVVKLLDEQNGLEPAYGQRPNSMDIDGMFTLPPSRLKMGGVFDFEHGRLDKRYFTPASIQRKYEKPLWSGYDLTTKDGRIQFIKSRGFEEFIHLKPIQFDVMPYALNMLESSEMFRELIKVSLPMLADRNSEDSEAILFKQAELNYKKSLNGSANGKFKIFMVEALDTIIDILAEKNKNN